MKLLAVSLARHDNNITYFDGERVRYIKLERTEQVKRFCISNKWGWIHKVKELWGLDVNDVDEVIFDFHPETFYDQFPQQIVDVLNGTVNAIKLTDDINVFKDYIKTENIWYISHHYAHALSCWMMTDVKPNVNIVIDGIGDGRTWSVFVDDKLVDSGTPRDGSIGGRMMQAAGLLNVSASNGNDSVGKLMGLQSYGTIDYAYLDKLKDLGMRHINDIFNIDAWKQHCGDELVASQLYLNWIKTVHEKVGNTILELFQTYVIEGDVVSYSGGVAQNVLWNSLLKKQYKDLIIPPHSGDEGLSLGSIEWLRIKNNLPKFTLENFPYSQSDHSTDKVSDETIRTAAKLLAEGKVVGWYQDNGELGPRALGNRSILMDPRIVDGKQHINRIKRRENYRPFGASVLAERVGDYFEDTFQDSYMLLTTSVKTDEYPAITHVDGTCRIQTVDASDHHFRKLLEEFYKLTGCAVLLNTSLNLAGKPLAGYPEVALDFFHSTPIDVMIIGNNIKQK